MIWNGLIGGIRKGFPPFVFLVSLFVVGCSEPVHRIHEKLDGVAQEDLRFIVAEILAGSDSTHLLKSPYFVVQDLRLYSGDSARKFAAYAEVDYHYFSDIKLIQKRKYRYLPRERQWDRYFKKFIRVKEVVPFVSDAGSN